ncbi:MAG TPA: hypothetical protein VKP30_12085 [Polyangiaceae bacterium]|nr:hypothetical protein [Polyangiaceae bacterium]
METRSLITGIGEGAQAVVGIPDKAQPKIVNSASSSGAIAHSVTAARREQERGAVLAEALIVIASLVLFLLLVLYFGKVFGRELQVQRAARAAAFAYADSGCDDNSGASLISPEDAKLIGAPTTQAGDSQTMAKDSEIKEARAQSAFSQASKDNGLGMPNSSSVGAQGQASMGNGLEISLHSRTTLLCNEKPKSGEIDGVIDYVAGFFK